MRFGKHLILLIVVVAMFLFSLFQSFVPPAFSPLEASIKIEKLFSREKSEEKEIRMLVFGDLMLDRYVSQKIKQKGVDFVFSEVSPLLKENDLILTNLEGPFTDLKPKNLKSDNLIFTFDPALLPNLKQYGFNLFNLANNHTLNYGKEGLNQSRNYLQQNSIDYFGDPLNDHSLSLIKPIKGVRFAFIGFNDLEVTDFNKVLKEIGEVKKEVEFVIVYVHWGNEYQTNFSQRQQEKGRQMIDYGADVVFGSHPHVIQPIEVYKEKVIFYSLGNFVFDQTFSKETQQGLVVRLVFRNQKVSYGLIPLDLTNVQVKVMKDSQRKEILEKISLNSMGSEKIKRQILEGRLDLDEGEK
ncbi:MAG: CapA family protein [bacterium]|nr:CapA family protein [bacterium]